MTEPEDFDHPNGGRNPYQPIFDVEGNLVDPAEGVEPAERVEPAEHVDAEEWAQASTPSDEVQSDPVHSIASVPTADEPAADVDAPVDEPVDDPARESVPVAPVFQDEQVADVGREDPDHIEERAPEPVADEPELNTDLDELDEPDDPDKTHVFGSPRTEQVSPYVARGLAEPTGNANLLYRDQRHDPFARPEGNEALDDPTLLHDPASDETAQLDEVQTPAELEAERAELGRQAREEAERVAEERAARNKALGVVSPSGAEVAQPVAPAKLVTDKFFGSTGLFLLRMVVAALLGIRTFQLAMNMNAFTDTLQRTMIPYPEIAAWVAVISMGLVAVALLLGVLVRVAGFGLLALSVLSLVFLRWGPNPFVNGELGFVGELELVLAAVGFLFISLGGGAWGLDGSYRRSRDRDRAAKA